MWCKGEVLTYKGETPNVVRGNCINTGTAPTADSLFPGKEIGDKQIIAGQV